jgi:hypothetical protein
MPTPLIPNIAVFQRKLAGFPIATYRAGEIVLAAASTTGRSRPPSRNSASARRAPTA